MTTQTLQKWNNSTLRESIKIIDGDRGINYPKQNEFFDSGYCLFLNTKNVPENSFVFDEKMFITQEKDSKLRKGKLTRGDFVLTTRGTVGNFAYYSEKIPFENVRINSGMVILRLDEDGKLSRDYFKFYLDSPLFKGQIKSHSTGSAQPQLPIRDLSVFKIEFPNLVTQQQIADVLSVYDDLIENNARRIDILEQLAQAIYTEWFVNFRFSGHEKVKMVDSGTDFGKIPEGWKVKKVEDLIERISPGKLYDNKTVSKKGLVPVLDQGRSGIIGYHNDIPGVEASIEKPVIVFANHTCYQRLMFFSFSAIQNVLPFYPLAENYRNIFWLHWATKDVISFNDYKGHWPEFMQKKVVVPTAEMAERFAELIKPFAILSYQLELANKNLRQTRDLLLPKLVSGEIRV